MNDERRTMSTAASACEWRAAAREERLPDVPPDQSGLLREMSWFDLPRQIGERLRDAGALLVVERQPHVMLILNSAPDSTGNSQIS
jgi:hypothetical protein